MDDWNSKVDLTNEDRLNLLKQSGDLMRKVEFSYPPGHPLRQRLYRQVVNTFGMFGDVHRIMEVIENEITKEKVSKIKRENFDETYDDVCIGLNSGVMNNE